MDGTKGIEPLRVSVASSCISTLLRADCTEARIRTLAWKVGASRAAVTLLRCGWRIEQDSNLWGCYTRRASSALHSATLPPIHELAYRTREWIRTTMLEGLSFEGLPVAVTRVRYVGTSCRIRTGVDWLRASSPAARRRSHDTGTSEWIRTTTVQFLRLLTLPIGVQRYGWNKWPDSNRHPHVGSVEC